MSIILETAVLLKDALCETMENTLVLKNNLWGLHVLGIDVSAEFDQIHQLRRDLRLKIARLDEFLNEPDDIDDELDVQ